MKRNKVSKTGIIVAILLLAIGFATVSTVLYINGVINIGPNTQDFEDKVIFKSASVGDGQGTAEITDNGKSIKFVTQVMKSINEVSTLTYTIENGSQYDAVIGELTCVAKKDDPNAGLIGTYVTITPANALKDTELKSGATSDSDTVTVKMIKSYAGDNDKTVEFTCTLNVDNK